MTVRAGTAYRHLFQVMKNINYYFIGLTENIREQITTEVGTTEDSKETITEPSQLMFSDSVLRSSVTTEQLHPADAE